LGSYHFNKYRKEYANVHLKLPTADSDKHNIGAFMPAQIAHLKITDVTRTHISALHHIRRQLPYEGNLTSGNHF
jgi:hypothetical protein